MASRRSKHCRSRPTRPSSLTAKASLAHRRHAVVRVDAGEADTAADLRRRRRRCLRRHLDAERRPRSRASTSTCARADTHHRRGDSGSAPSSCRRRRCPSWSMRRSGRSSCMRAADRGLGERRPARPVDEAGAARRRGPRLLLRRVARHRRRSFSTSRAALWPGTPVTPPPG